jgi:hypothetical protein
VHVYVTISVTDNGGHGHCRSPLFSSSREDNAKGWHKDPNAATCEYALLLAFSFLNMHAELTAGAFIAAFTVLIPWPWHWRARSVPTLSMIIWLFITNIIFAVNTIIWAGSIAERVPVWCDISAYAAHAPCTPMLTAMQRRNFRLEATSLSQRLAFVSAFVLRASLRLVK